MGGPSVHTTLSARQWLPTATIPYSFLSHSVAGGLSMTSPNAKLSENCTDEQRPWSHQKAWELPPLTAHTITEKWHEQKACIKRRLFVVANPIVSSRVTSLSRTLVVNEMLHGGRRLHRCFSWLFYFSLLLSHFSQQKKRGNHLQTHSGLSWGCHGACNLA